MQITPDSGLWDYRQKEKRVFRFTAWGTRLEKGHSFKRKGKSSFAALQLRSFFEALGAMLGRHWRPCAHVRTLGGARVGTKKLGAMKGAPDAQRKRIVWKAVRLSKAQYKNDGRRRGEAKIVRAVRCDARPPPLRFVKV